MISLHPYQSIYFNKLVRHENIGSQFETDYWGASVRESIDWIENNVTENSKVVYNSLSRNFMRLGKDNLQLFLEGDFSTALDDNKPFYYLAFPRANVLNIDEPLPECQTVYQVSRNLKPITLNLSQVKYCE